MLKSMIFQYVRQRLRHDIIIIMTGSRNMSSNTSTSSTTAWERTAVRCKDPKQHDNKYIQEIRTTVHDSPAMHLKSLQDELQSAVGQALGRQGAKVLRAIQVVHAIQAEYEQLLMKNHKHDPHNHAQLIQQCIERHDKARQAAIQVRWELKVHRQAAGFLVNNHAVVTETFPIPGPIVRSDNGEDKHYKSETEKASEASRKQQYGDQLEWWQRVGRWK